MKNDSETPECKRASVPESRNRKAATWCLLGVGIAASLWPVVYISHWDDMRPDHVFVALHVIPESWLNDFWIFHFLRVVVPIFYPLVLGAFCTFLAARKSRGAVRRGIGFALFGLDLLAMCVFVLFEAVMVPFA